MINKDIFRANDVRGLAMGDEIQIDKNTAYQIGMGICTYFLRKGCKHLALGRDGRLTSDELEEAFLDGAVKTGMKITRLGFCPSPMLYFASCTDKFDCGVNITASHNPSNYNGFKFVCNNADKICGEEIQKVLQIILDEDYESGQGEVLEYDLSSEYFAHLNSLVTIQKPIKIVMDSANAITGPFLDQLCSNSNIELVKLYDDLDGTFPNHSPRPDNSSTMVDLGRVVRENKADFGIAFDGDGDRVGVVDENGVYRNLDLLVMILARDFLSRNPGEKIVFDSKCSKVLENDIIEHGGIPVRYKTGHSLIEEYITEHNIRFAGEMSGHFFLKEKYFGFDDAMYAALVICEIYANAGHKFSSFYDGLPEVFNTQELRLLVDGEKKVGYIEQAKEYFREGGYVINETDGCFVEFDGTSWALIRHSNTEDKVTLRFESQSKETVNVMLDVFIDLFKELEIDHVETLEQEKLK